jgi:hypothetical protein
MSLPSIAVGTHPEDDRAVVWIRTPYRERFVAELKGMLPWEARGWAPDEKAWWVLEEHRETAEHLMLQHFGEIQVFGQGGESDYVLSPDGTITEQPTLFD